MEASKEIEDKEYKETVEEIKKEMKKRNMSISDISLFTKIEENKISNFGKDKFTNLELLRLVRVFELDPLVILGKIKDFNINDVIKENQVIEKGIKKTIICESWQTFFDYYAENIFSRNDEEYIWRGHKNLKWKLESTLLREYNGGISPENMGLIVHKFKKALLGNNERIEIEKFHISREAGEQTEEDLWLSLGQHHGLKTPFLDWTYSPFVATYFSFVDSYNASPYRVVYAINKTKLTSIIKNNDEVKIISPENNFNKRLINQQGLFIYGSLEKDLEKWIEENNYNNEKSVIYEFLIPNIERKNILKILYKMNINPKILFPDLNGAALNANLEIELEI